MPTQRRECSKTTRKISIKLKVAGDEKTSAAAAEALKKATAAVATFAATSSDHAKETGTAAEETGWAKTDNPKAAGEAISADTANDKCGAKTDDTPAYIRGRGIPTLLPRPLLVTG